MAANYSAFKKQCQVSSGDTWSKHAGSTKHHKKANRIERKRLKRRLRKEGF